MADLGGQKAAECKMLGRLGKERNPLSSSVVRTPWLPGEKKAQWGKLRTEVTEGDYGCLPENSIGNDLASGEKKGNGPVSRTEAAAST
jgi:hypothetical protein